MKKKNKKKNKKKSPEKTKKIFQGPFFYVKIQKISSQSLLNKKKNKDIIVISKKCGPATKRNYIRRITRYLIKENDIKAESKKFIFIFMQNLDQKITYKKIRDNFIQLKQTVVSI